MNNRCEILDDDEIELQEKNKAIFNFRRFDASQLEKSSSIFDKTQKKEFPFLFQKKPKKFIEEKKISLDEITSKLNSIKLDNNKNAIIANDSKMVEDEYLSNTPPWDPRLYNDDDLKVSCEIQKDGTK